MTVPDPGRALISHRLVDPATGNPEFGAFKPPILHNLAARAPFSHNGAAGTLDEVLEFYNQMFDIRLTQKNSTHQLVAFLRAL